MIGHLLAKAIWVAFKWWCAFCAVLYLIALFKSYEDHYGPAAAAGPAPIVIDAAGSDD
jgi:hypothetical protein